MPDPLSEQLGSKSNDNSNQGKSSFLGTLGQNTLSSLVSGGVSSLFSELFADSQQHRLRENMRYQQQLNLDSLRKSPLMQVLGLKDAGLNPALLNGQVTGNTAQVQQGSPSGALTPMQAMFDTVALQKANNESSLLKEEEKTQKSLQNTQTEQANVLKEEARAKKIQNDREESADIVASSFAQDIYYNLLDSHVITPRPEGDGVEFTFHQVGTAGYKSNLGSLRALMDVYDSLRRSNPKQWQNESSVLGESTARSLLYKAGYDEALKDPLVVSALAEMPKFQVWNLIELANKYSSDVILNNSTGKLQMSQDSLNKALSDYYDTLSDSNEGSGANAVNDLTKNIKNRYARGAVKLFLNMLMSGSSAAAQAATKAVVK